MNIVEMLNSYIVLIHYTQNETFQANICIDYDDYGLQLLKT